MENLSAEDKEFLAKCESELKDRYTENDKDFMEVFNAERVDPPVVENWWVRQNYGRRGTKRRYDSPNSRYRENRHYQYGGYQNRGYHQGRSCDERGPSNKRGRY